MRRLIGHVASGARRRPPSARGGRDGAVVGGGGGSGVIVGHGWRVEVSVYSCPACRRGQAPPCVELYDYIAV